MSQVLVSLAVLTLLFGTAAYPLWMLVRPVAETARSQKAVVLFCIFLGGVMGLVIGGTHDAMLGKLLMPITSQPLGLYIGPYIGVALTLGYLWRHHTNSKPH